MNSKLISTGLWLGYVVIVIILLPSVASAWGPGAHIECSDFLLKNLILLAPAVRKLLKNHPFEFIYGSVCPDMVLGKRFMRPENCNHNWQVSLNLLNSAKGPRQKSFALGYLSHLAADTIAHNLFVPDQLLRNFDRRRRNHVMQELIFDAMLGDEVWKIARLTAKKPFPDCEQLLHRHLPRTPLPNRINLKIFRSGVLLVRLGTWQRIIRRLRARWGEEMDTATMTPYLEAIHETVIDFMNDPLASPCLQRSPMGGHVLPAAHDLRKTLKRLNQQDRLVPEQHSSLLADFQQWREQALFNQ